DHASHYQGRIHKESGRIYRIKAKDPIRSIDQQLLGQPFDLAKEWNLARFLGARNKWLRQAARREMLISGPRPWTDWPVTLDALPRQVALEVYWAAVAAGLGNEDQMARLDHADPYIRLWAVRLSCDDGAVTDELATKLADLAYREPNVEVRSQLACSARRLPTAQSLPIVKNLAQ